MSGHCPAALNLTLGFNQIGQEGAKSLAEALNSGQCPPGLTLDLAVNQIGTEGAKNLAEALKLGQCPLELTLSLGVNKIEAEGIKALEQALVTGNGPQGLNIRLNEEQRMIDPLLKLYSDEPALEACIALQKVFEDKTISSQKNALAAERFPQDCLNKVYEYVLLPVKDRKGQIISYERDKEKNIIERSNYVQNLVRQGSSFFFKTQTLNKKQEAQVSLTQDKALSPLSRR